MRDIRQRDVKSLQRHIDKALIRFVLGYLECEKLNVISQDEATERLLSLYNYARTMPIYVGTCARAYIYIGRQELLVH